MYKVERVWLSCIFGLIISFQLDVTHPFFWVLMGLSINFSYLLLEKLDERELDKGAKK